MTYRDSQAARRALQATAERQGGYFTAKQAIAVGYARPHLSYHVSAGNFEHVGRGLYRLPTVPVGEHDEFVRLSLWSRGRDDVPMAVVSHASALALHDLGQTLPGKVHLTVPPGFRKSAAASCVLHRARLRDSEIDRREGFTLTRPTRTLLDVAESISSEELREAVADGLSRGVVTLRKLRSAAKAHPAGERMLDVLVGMS